MPLARRTIGAALAATVCLGVLSGCVPGSAADHASAYDRMITHAPIADSGLIEKNAWAAAVRARGYLRIGGQSDVPLLSDATGPDGEVQGFEVGLAQMLARYITGNTDVAKLVRQIPTTDTSGQQALADGTIDVVVGPNVMTSPTSSNLAGPFNYSTALLVPRGTRGLTGLTSLSGRSVVADPDDVQELTSEAPDVDVRACTPVASCVLQVQTGAAAGYLHDLDDSLTLVRDSNDLVISGMVPTQLMYGIGVPPDDPAAVQFVTRWLQIVAFSGDWTRLWKATIGREVHTHAPLPPIEPTNSGS